ncbi:TPA: hypothetical protein PJH62_003148 [Acinetobacter nosocomialis]|uniref:Uncharacterized protein n=1 Tax=Acinetobacter nosocomialis TaxID=106654 RepID=A0AB37CVF9_ACINO|nr:MULTISPECIES: hypothetical protein [Acinetobacter calcoaceticus/baumannii complex]ELW81944.1 hypothetical protein ACIN5021_2219 [Acinetobacter sp. OIFC021]EXE49036.1 hypothetical protein J576_2818 [Acinetobacter sp. 766875]MDE1667780.1 hypothetical protein [Acinetobacter nosocomialis]MDE9415077.1 hypothetical protein [Acinetobacter nosocomialis]QGA44137.1 hypothetical protein GD578_09945 [Acinetobacter nosocomialis]
MKIFTVDQNSALTRYAGQSLVIKFDDGKILEINDSQEPLAAFPEGILIWSGRAPNQEPITDLQFSQLSITPVASNGIIIAPYQEQIVTAISLTMFVTDENAQLLPIKEKNVVIELKSGKTIEVLEDYAKKGLLVWGGREPISGLSIEQLKERTESLGIYPMASNVIYLFPFKLS